MGPGPGGTGRSGRGGGTPGYFASHPEPRSPHDLPSHRCVNFRHGSAGVYRWEFAKGDQSLAVAVNGPLVVDDLGIMTRAAIDGVGPAFMSEEHAAPHLASGAPVRVLEDWCPPYAGYVTQGPSIPRADFRERSRVIDRPRDPERGLHPVGQSSHRQPTRPVHRRALEAIGRVRRAAAGPPRRRGGGAPRSYRLRFLLVSVSVNTIGMLALPIPSVGGVVVISARAIMSVSTIKPASVLA